MSDLTGQGLMKRVPQVFEETCLATVLRAMSQYQAEQAVVLNAERQVLGVLHVQAILPYLTETTDWATRLVGDGFGLQSVCPVDRSLSPEELWQAFQANPDCYWWVPGTADDSVELLVPESCWAFGNAYGHLPLWRSNQRYQSVAALPDPQTVVALDLERSLSLPALCQLIDQLPLPLMLQTDHGQVVAQNSAWSAQLAAIHNPDAVWRKLAAFLSGEAGDWLSPLGLEPSSWLAGMHSDVFSSESMSQDVLFTSMNELQMPGSCQPVPNSSTCVCLCGMQEGGDRIWQFSGTRLGHLPAASDAGRSASNPPTEQLWLILALDVTEQHQMAKDLAAKNADLMQLNRLKDEFLACISHELRTPLTAVLGLSNLLKDQMIGSLNDRQSRYANLIYQSGRHLMMIVNDILDLTRIETGQLHLNMEPLSIHTVCERALEQAKQIHLFDDSEELSETASSQTLPAFQLSIQPTVETIVADELRMRQMLANLLSNALKFTEDSGEFGLTVEEWHGWIAFSVWDTGIGIPHNQQHLIFQKFQQLEHPLTRQFEGTGLGLVLTQRLARLHGGDVTFTSTEGRGSTFTLLLPPDPSFQGIQPRLLRQQATTWPGRYLVLVVEAVPQFLEDLQQPLSEMGYRLAIARSGTEALEKARQLQPIMIFLNPVLPQLSGWDVLTLLRSHEETCDIPVIITTSRSDRGKALSHGASAFLGFPIQPELLQQIVDSVVMQLGQHPNPKLEQLTLLHLRPGGLDHPDPAPPSPPPAPRAWDTAHERVVLQGERLELEQERSPDLATLLRSYPCRVLEVDDLDQAELLARVWKPNLVLLDGHLSHPLRFMQTLGQKPALAALPLITLSPENTQAAHQVRELTVCPFTPPNPDAHLDINISALLQMMCQVAGLGLG